MGKYIYSKISGRENKDHKREFPEPLSDTMKDIGKHFPDYVISSLLVNEIDEKGFLPEHSDDEQTINPESFILTLSIGGCGKLTYKSLLDNSERTHVALPRSLYAMTRESVSYTHLTLPTKA